MAKILKYKLVCGEENIGTDEAPVYRAVFSDVEMTWSAGNEEIAKREAVNGEYEIVEDGKPESPPSVLDRIEAQIAYTAMMTDTLTEV